MNIAVVDVMCKKCKFKYPSNTILKHLKNKTFMDFYTQEELDELKTSSINRTKELRKIWKKNHKMRIKVNRAQFYQKNKEKYKLQNAKYHEKNWIEINAMRREKYSEKKKVMTDQRNVHKESEVSKDEYIQYYEYDAREFNSGMRFIAKDGQLLKDVEELLEKIKNKHSDQANKLRQKLENIPRNIAKAFKENEKLVDESLNNIKSEHSLADLKLRHLKLVDLINDQWDCVLDKNYEELSQLDDEVDMLCNKVISFPTRHRRASEKCKCYIHNPELRPK